MKLHSNTLTTDDIRASASLAGCGVERLTEHGSRSRDHAHDVILSGAGRTAQSGGFNGASWDQWGIVLESLYRIDDTLLIPSIYWDHDHFRWVTSARFDTLTFVQAHHLHRWVPEGLAVTGTYYVNRCKGCGTVQRSLARGHRWEDIAS